jgi:2-succinyl-5-enolpyruvyl-6-hydroxy-3-cyclohexene-1-carboxylate synthase
VAEFKHVFEKYFSMPHNYNFSRAAEMFDINYYQPVTKGEFLQTYQSCISGNKSSLIEIITNRDENFKLHQDIQLKIKSVLEK